MRLAVPSSVPGKFHNSPRSSTRATARGATEIDLFVLTGFQIKGVASTTVVTAANPRPHAPVHLKLRSAPANEFSPPMQRAQQMANKAVHGRHAAPVALNVQELTVQRAEFAVKSGDVAATRHSLGEACRAWASLAEQASCGVKGGLPKRAKQPRTSASLATGS